MKKHIAIYSYLNLFVFLANGQLIYHPKTIVFETMYEFDRDVPTVFISVNDFDLVPGPFAHIHYVDHKTYALIESFVISNMDDVIGTKPDKEKRASMLIIEDSTYTIYSQKYPCDAAVYYRKLIIFLRSRSKEEKTNRIIQDLEMIIRKLHCGVVDDPKTHL